MYFVVKVIEHNECDLIVIPVVGGEHQHASSTCCPHHPYAHHSKLLGSALKEHVINDILKKWTGVEKKLQPALLSN